MKSLLSFLLLLLCAPCLWAQAPKEGNRALVTLTAYDAQGQLLRSTNGFFCSAQGHVCLPYTLLKDAQRIEVVDAQGRTAQVQRIVGISSALDLACASTNIPTRKLSFLLPAQQKAAEPLWQTYYTTQKKELPESASLLKSEKLDTLYYYTLSTSNEARYWGTPLLDSQGHVAAIVQRNVTKDAQNACAMDGRALQQLLDPNALPPLLNSDWRGLHFAPALSTTEEEKAYSTLFLTLLAPSDTTVAATLIGDFQRLYPKSRDLYAPAAQFHANKRNDLPTAHTWIKRGLAHSGPHRAPLYALLAELMQRKALTDTISAPHWTLNDALTAADSAYALKPDTAYVRQQAQVLQQLGRWEEAQEKWQIVNASSLATWESWLRQASCAERLQRDSLEVLRLIDAAVQRMEQQQAHQPQLYMTRANYLLQNGQTRAAVADLQRFEKSLPPGQQPKASFYAERSQVEVQAKMYQQALDDLDTALGLATTATEREAYLLGKAYLQLRVSLWPEAAATAHELLRSQPNSAEAHKILGLSHGERKQKAKALQHLRRAQALGDAQAAQFIKTYSK